MPLDKRSPTPRQASALLLLLLLASPAAPVARAADGDEDDDVCPALQDRALRAYDSPECAYAREVTSAGDVFAGSTPPPQIVCNVGDGDGLSCITNVTEVVEGFIEHGCAVPSGVEGLAGFLYPVHDYGVDFIGATRFYCSASGDGCYELVRDTLEECTDVINAECFRQLPCPCVDGFVIHLGDIKAADFREDYGPSQDITDAAKEAKDKSYCQVPPSPAPSGGNLYFVSSAAVALTSLVALTAL